MPDPIDTQIVDAVESSLWQDLADALNRLEDWGLIPLPDVAEVDAGDVIHGGSPRVGGYLLRLKGAEGDGPGNCWAVASRPASGATVVAR